MSKASKDVEKRECHICGSVISGGSYCYKAHLFIHNAVKPRFKCSICLKPYFRKDTYVRHMNNHIENGDTTGQINLKKCYICDYCDRSFRDKRNLINHLKIHDDMYYSIAPKYECPACHTSYCEERLLKNHIRKEHFNLEWKENVYELKQLNETWIEPMLDSKSCVEMTKVKNNVICIKKCNVKNEMADSIKKYLIEFKDIMQYSKVTCDYCKKVMLKKSLIKHIKERHLKIKKFSCNICKRSYKRHYQLVDHECGKVRTRLVKQEPRTTLSICSVERLAKKE